MWDKEENSVPALLTGMGLVAGKKLTLVLLDNINKIH